MELIFLAMGLFLFTQVAQADWTPARRLTWSSVDSCLPRVFVDNSGKVHLVWYEGSPEYPDYGNGEIHYRKSADGGASWTTNKMIIDNQSDSKTPDIAVDSSYRVHVVWDDAQYFSGGGNSNIVYKKSANGGVTWSYLKCLTWSYLWNRNPDITVDSSDDLHLVWEDDTPGNREIYYRKSTDAGTTWSTSKRLTWTAGASVYPAVCADSSNKIHVFWNDDTPGNDEIYYRKTTDGGATWSSVQRLTWSAGASENPAVAADSFGNLHLMWADYTPGDYEVFYRKSTDGGGIWSSSKRLTWTAGESEFPAISVDSSNEIHVVWNDNVAGNNEIYYAKSTDGGSNWTTSQRITYSAGHSWHAVIASDSSGNLHVLWSDNTPGNYQIYYKKFIK